MDKLLSLWPKLVVIFTVSFLLGCQEETPAIEEKSVQRVATAPLSTLLKEQYFQRPASVLSVNDAVISAEIMARVESVSVKVGEKVEKGDVLVELSCQDQQSKLKQAQAQLAANIANVKLSQSELERAKQLYSKRSLSKQELDRRQNEHTLNRAEQRTAQAAIEIAKNNSSKCVIFAPFEGVIVERSISTGQLAQTGLPLVRLIDDVNLEVSAHLTTSEVRSLSQTKQVSFVQQDNNYPLKLNRVTHVVDNLRRTQETRLLFAEEKPLPGTAGDIIWLHPSPMLPAELISLRDGQAGLLYLNNENQDKAVDSPTGVVQFYPLQNTLEGQPVPIEFSGQLTGTMSVITSGRFGVSVGDEVTVAN